MIHTKVITLDLDFPITPNSPSEFTIVNLLSLFIFPPQSFWYLSLTIFGFSELSIHLADQLVMTSYSLHVLSSILSSLNLWWIIIIKFSLISFHSLDKNLVNIQLSTNSTPGPLTLNLAGKNTQQCWLGLLWWQILSETLSLLINNTFI